MTTLKENSLTAAKLNMGLTPYYFTPDEIYKIAELVEGKLSVDLKVAELPIEKGYQANSLLFDSGITLEELANVRENKEEIIEKFSNKIVDIIESFANDGTVYMYCLGIENSYRNPGMPMMPTIMIGLRFMEKI